ncbi:MAG: HAMP domain-containing sensor histidine kinase [Pseudomonadota bacterium]|nr:HAMP domain-containing sensor histidine kinase [Pseudomonadota bacterium]
MRPRIRSLRVRAVLVVAAVVVAPLVLVWMSDRADTSVERRMLLEAERIAAESAAAWAPGRAAGLDALAERGQVRIRVVEGESVVADYDHEASTGLTWWLGSFFFEPGAAPSLATWDAGELPLASRAEVAEARGLGHSSGCSQVADGRLTVCRAALATGAPGGGVVTVHQSSRRSILALHELRYQFAKLTLVTLLVGLGFGWWLGWRMVLPLEALQRQLEARAVTRRPAPVVLDRDDEFGDLAVSFNVLVAALLARDRANEAFAADLVHEVKNPVAAVRAVAEALERPADAERIARLARVLRDSSDRLDVLARRFLELARAEAGLAGDPRENVDLGVLVAALVDGMRVDERHARVTFIVEAHSPAVVSGVPERLETAVRNLLENAAHFARGEVRVGVRVESTFVLLSVKDDGPGIAAEDLPRIFDRFFTRRAGEGTGLGLALARAVVEAHGGTLEVSGGVFVMRVGRA